ncbi:MAG: putative toxin-antitoxin system toxin component, PIN family [Bifidobacteriaceae bacterium]|jgi:putative PIN family toxin of toxin-antitoxin system|nr:putative toxin-antitoxin system toxin component, PIN family [Bifidobacteriaceae bacterium]
MPVKVVLDTNILVSALLSPTGAPARVLALVLQGDLLPCHNRSIIAEYRAVLSRPKFNLDPHMTNQLVQDIETHGLPVITQPMDGLVADPDDAPFAAVAVTAGATLVTGNTKHFPGVPSAIGPAGFLGGLGQQDG